MDPLCTNKLTQKKCQRNVSFYCTGERTKSMCIYNLICIRSKDRWLVKQKGRAASLTAKVGADPFRPPTTGWLFRKGGVGDFEEDPSLTCSLPSTSSPCCLTVTLSGAAKEAHEYCEGEYKRTGLISMGKQVTGTLKAFVTIVHSQRCSNWKALKTAIYLLNLAFHIGVSLLT